MMNLLKSFSIVLLAVAGFVSCSNGQGVQAPAASGSADVFLDDLQERTFAWFWDTTNPQNGLTPDRWPTPSFSSVAAVGFALTAYPIGVERGWVTREQARDRTLTTIRFFWEAPQDSATSGITGYKGFFYHFLDMNTGHRFRNVELSTIDTALLMGGVLTAQSYFDGNDNAETAIRAYADSLYRRVEWDWAVVRPSLISMGWHPERGYIDADYKGYDEAMLLYVLALGSPTFPVDASVWNGFTSTYVWGDFNGYEHVNFPPLFGHQYSHVWIDFKGIQDAYMKDKGIDYFENSRRATYGQRAYGAQNPDGWKDYSDTIWGWTASDGPIDSVITVNGTRREFHTYFARGVSFDWRFDDGTIVPTAAGGSIPFAPEICIPALQAMKDRYGDVLYSKYGFKDAFNPTFGTLGVKPRMGEVTGGIWVDGDYLGIDQGPILAMAENHRSGLVWQLIRKNPYIIRGLCRAGFTGGWLEGKCSI